MLISNLIDIQFFLLCCFIMFIMYQNRHNMQSISINKISYILLIVITIYLVYKYYSSQFYKHKLLINLNGSFIGSNNNHINLLSYM